MAVIQQFIVTVGTTECTIDRDEAEALFADLAEALGTAPAAGLADDMASLIGAVERLGIQVQNLHAVPAGMFPQEFTILHGDESAEDGEPEGQSMDIDSYLARQQALAQVPPPATGGRHPGSGIGNTHVN